MVIIVQPVPPFSLVTLNLIGTRAVLLAVVVVLWGQQTDRSAMIGLFDIVGLSSSSSSPSSSYRRYSTPLVQGRDVNFPI